MPDSIDATEHPSTVAAVRDLAVLDRATLDDGDTYALFDGDAEYANLFVVNESDDETGMFITKGGGNAVNQYDGETEWGGSTGAQNNNLFHDGTDYVIENSTGSDGKDYTVVGVRVV